MGGFFFFQSYFTAEKTGTEHLHKAIQVGNDRAGAKARFVGFHSFGRFRRVVSLELFMQLHVLPADSAPCIVTHWRCLSECSLCCGCWGLEMESDTGVAKASWR